MTSEVKPHIPTFSCKWLKNDRCTFARCRRAKRPDQCCWNCERFLVCQWRCLTFILAYIGYQYGQLRKKVKPDLAYSLQELMELSEIPYQMEGDFEYFLKERLEWRKIRGETYFKF